MGNQEGDDVGLLISLLVIREFKDLVFREVGLDDHVVRVFAFHDLGDDVFGGAFAQVVDIGFEGQAHQGDAGFAAVFQGKVLDGALGFVGAPEGFVVVDLA